jgi:hypothetical protein
MAAATEAQMNAVERIKEYIDNIDQEDGIQPAKWQLLTPNPTPNPTLTTKVYYLSI